MNGLLALAFAAGMVAPVNPCGFALLPAWLTLSFSDATNPSLAARLVGALRSGAALTIGFAGTLVAVGLMVSAGAHAMITAAPWLGFAVGLVLLVVALPMIAGRTFGLRVPGVARRRAGRIGIAQAVLYGVGYAAASLSCTFGILLAVIAQAQATDTYAGLVLVFVAYAAGAATILLLLAAVTAVAGTTITRHTATLARTGPRITGVVLALTGGYLAWYWYPAALHGATATRTGGFASLAATTSTWIQAHTTTLGLSAAAVALTVAALALYPASRRRRVPPTEPGGHTSAECCLPQTPPPAARSSSTQNASRAGDLT